MRHMDDAHLHRLQPGAEGLQSRQYQRGALASERQVLRLAVLDSLGGRVFLTTAAAAASAAEGGAAEGVVVTVAVRVVTARAAAWI